MFGHLGAACCCDGTAPDYPSAVLIYAQLGLIRAYANARAYSDPRDPATFPDPEPPTTCDVSIPALTCTLSCGLYDSTPSNSQIVCPDGVSLDNPRPWGSGLFQAYYGREWYFRDDPLTLPYDAGGGTTDSGVALVYKRVPPGGGSSVAIGSGSWECVYRQYYGEFEQMVPVETTLTGSYKCVQQIVGESEVISEPVNAEFRGRKYWTTPPSVMQVKAPSTGWTIGISGTTMTVVDPLLTSSTKDLTTVDFDGLYSWLTGLLLLVYDSGGGSWSSEPVGPFDADMLGALATTAIPSGIASPLDLRIHNVGDPITMSGDDDQAVEANWTVTILDDVGATKVAFLIPYHKFSGTEAELVWGAAADYQTGGYLAGVTSSLEDWGYNGLYGNVLPIPGDDYTGYPLAYIKPSGVGTYSTCWTNSTTASASWDQDPGDCWVACQSSASRTIEGGLALWMLVGVP